MTVPTAEAVLAALVTREIEEMRERRFERRGDLECVEREIEGRLDPGDHRSDAKTGRNFIHGKAPEQTHAVAAEPDFLFGFAQRSVFTARIVRLDAPSRKADLSRVVRQMRRSLSEKQLHAALTPHERDHDGGLGHARARRQRGDVKVLGRGCRRRAREALGDRLRRHNRKSPLVYRLTAAWKELDLRVRPLAAPMEYDMKISTLFLAAALAGASGAALAFHCPADMKAIDAAMSKAKLDDKQMGEVKKLRAEGETLHKAGKHQESIDTLAKAKKILGI